MRRVRIPRSFDPTDPVLPRPGLGTAALAVLGHGLCIAVAETILGDLDQTDDFAAMSAAPGRLVAGGMVHLLGAVLLGVAIAGLARVIWPTVVGKVATVLLAVAVPCGGAFAMFHLVLAETTAAGLDSVAMEQFVVDRTAGSGAWGAPVAFYALAGFTASVLMLVALARVRVISWIPAALMLAAFLAETMIPSGMAEITAHWVGALAWGVAALAIWRVAAAHTAGAGAGAPLQPDPVAAGGARSLK